MPNTIVLPGDKHTYQLSILNAHNHACGSTGVLPTLPFGPRYNMVLNTTPTP